MASRSSDRRAASAASYRAPSLGHRTIERSWSRVMVDVVQRLLSGPSACVTVDVSNAILQRLPQVGAHSAVPPRLERVDPPERVEECVLYEVGCVNRGARPTRQAAVRKSAQKRQVSRQQHAERARVVLLGALEQLDRCQRGGGLSRFRSRTERAGCRGRISGMHSVLG
jgi:hypothetical protein